MSQSCLEIGSKYGYRSQMQMFKVRLKIIFQNIMTLLQIRPVR